MTQTGVKVKEVPRKTETQPKVKNISDNLITRRSKASNGNGTINESGKLLGNNIKWGATEI